MVEEYFYYQIERNQDGFLLMYYGSEQGFIEIVDSCSLSDIETMNHWHNDFDVDLSVYN